VGGGASRVGNYGEVKQHWSELSNLAAQKNGYLLVYVSNESNFTVYFDNLQVVHKPGLIVEETHYYSFGLVMNGISSKGLNGTADNKLKFNGKEEQRKEFYDGAGLDWLDFGARMYDAQIGRWNVLDLLAHKFAWQSPYCAMDNNPVFKNDPTGMASEPPGDFYDKKGNYLGTDAVNDKKVYHADAVTKNKDGIVTNATNAKEWNYSVSDTKFQEYLPTLLGHEGGFVNNPKDPGGSTNKGVTLNSFEKYALDLLNVQPTLDNLKRLTDNQAAAIYEVGYWNPSGAGNISDKQTGWLHFDTYVNGGASSVLENTIKAYGENGRGVNILNFIIKSNSGENVFNTYKQERLNRYDRIIQSNPKLGAFKNGWINRVNRFQYQKN
jgi:RHS repeat-associated protein